MKLHVFDLNDKLHGICRINLSELDVKEDDIIRISSDSGSTAVTALPLRPTDDSIGIIRIDALSRNNCGVNVGDEVSVEKITTQKAKRVMVKLLEMKPTITTLKMIENMPVQIGDNVVMPLFDKIFECNIINTEPNGVVTINTDTAMVDIDSIASGMKALCLLNPYIRESVDKMFSMFEVDPSIQSDRLIFGNIACAYMGKEVGTQLTNYLFKN